MSALEGQGDPIIETGGPIDETIDRLLRALRGRLGLDVAFVSELDEGHRVFRYVDTETSGLRLEVGVPEPEQLSYCRYVVDGQLPEFLADPSAHPVSAGLDVTHQLPVGTHLSVPIRFSDGTVYGTLCSFGFDVHADLDERDLSMLRLLADVVGGYLEEREGQRRQEAQRRRRLEALAADVDLDVVFQPIVDLAELRTVGVEALARFPALGQPPDRVFADAWQLGVGVDLETKAIRAALARLADLPDGTYLAVNASPATLSSPELMGLLDGVPGQRLVVEVTEHAAVTDYAALSEAIRTLEATGARLAIDDAGTGFSGLHQILQLAPDIIKIDRALTTGIDTAPAKQAMITALVTYARQVGTTLVAEGIETQDELETLQRLGVPHGQGYHLARPAPLEQLMGAALERRAR